MGRRRKQEPARQLGDVSAPLGDETAQAAADDLAGSDGGGDLDSDEAQLGAGDPGLDVEPGGAGDIDAVVEAEDDPASAPGPASVVPDATAAEPLAPPVPSASAEAPVDGAQDQGTATGPTPGAHPAPAPQMPALRRGHVFARVRGTVALMATGYTRDGEQRSRWSAGEEAQFRRADVESLPEHFEELS
jgi:hypothetical protein